MLEAMAALLLMSPGAAGAPIPRVAVGQPIPDFTLTTAEGRKLPIRELRGKRVLLFMWASW